MEVTQLIPQRAPIVMVDEFVGFDGDDTVTRLTVRPDNIMVDDGRLSECGLIEHIAQSAAARVGYIFKSQNEPIPLGYIGSVNKFKFNTLPCTGDVIETRIRVVQEVFNVSLIEAICRIGKDEVASCSMKIFLDK